jgi:PKD repeat protein
MSRVSPPVPVRRRLVAVSIGALTALALVAPTLALLAAPAEADTAPVATSTEKTVSSDALPTAQIGQGVVWDQVIVGNTVYVTGEFTTARPAGVAVGGAGQVARTNLMAYNLTTGALLPWAPTLNGVGKTIKASADGSTIYVGGGFTQVNGTPRNRLAAINASTGALLTAFNPNPNARVNVLSVTPTTIFVGGIFTTMGGQARTRLAAVNPVNGALQPWAPAADSEVMSMTVPAGTNQVVVGGHFTQLNTTPASGLGAISTLDGAVVPFAINQVIQNGGNDAGVTSLTSDGSMVYGTGYTFGPGNFEGTFSAVSNGGQLVTITGCRGDTYDATVAGNVLYSVSHSHDCSAIGGNPTTDPWTYQHAWAQTTTADASGRVNVSSPFGANFVGRPAPELLHWLPTFNTGTFTGMGQAAWTVESNSQYVVAGGEFTKVNNGAQQGLVRFAVSSLATNKQGPNSTTLAAQLAPNLLALQPGRVRVSWTSAWDRDNRNLRYQVLRGTTVIGTVQGDSSWWDKPVLTFQDTTAPVGTTQSYRIRVTDAFGNLLTSGTKTIDVPVGTGTTSVYADATTGDGATHLWRLGESSGTTAYDYAGAADLAVDASATRGADGAMVNDATARSTTFSGTAGVPAVSPVQETAPQTFTAEGWFRTTSTRGGKIIGFGNSATGDSSSYDRHIYLSNDGRIVFGVYPNAVRTISSPKTGYNDGQWHYVAAGLSQSGIELFVDGKRVARDAGTTSAQTFSGYWRIGGDNTGGWPNQPGNVKFAGQIEDVAVYPAPLSLTQVQNHFQASGRSLNLPTKPTDAYGAAVWDGQPSFFWRLDEAAGVSTATDRVTSTPTGTYSAGVVRGEAGSSANPSGTSIRLPGNGTQTVVSSTAVDNPTVYSTEVWFRTTTTDGGRLIGFGNSNDPNGTSNSYDRYVWMQNDGTLRYGIYTGNTVTVGSTQAYNDGVWHLATATQSGAGMRLYVDGALVGSDPTTTPQPYTGYWRLGTDNVWFGANTANFAGSLDEAAVYDTALSASTVDQHYQLGKPVAANQAPTASFTSSANDLKADFDASASSDPDGSIASYAWQFGDGDTSSAQKPSHTYAAAGTYTVALTVTDDKGASATVTRTVTVTRPANQLPAATFTTSTAKLRATFDASGSSDPDGSIASYAWDFGDGGTGTGSTPSHLYGAPGTYTVGLTVTDDRGGASLVSKTVTVVGNVAPAAAFTATATDLAVAFDGSASSDPDGTIASYAWDFGDGGTGAVAKPNHTYATAGTKTVKLTVTDNDGATNTTTQTVTVSPANNPPTAAFTSSATDLTVAFDGTTSTDSDGTVASYAWDFGDGTSSTASKPSKTYTAAGTYTVTLTVKDDKGAAGTVSKVVTVTAPNQKPVARFTANGSALTYAFDATSSSDPDGTITGYTWNFGDGATATGPTASHTYAAGTYTVTLTVKDDKNATDTATKSVSPAPTPNQSPTAAFTSSTSGLTANLDGTGSSDPDGSVTGWSWNFGDTTTGTGATPAHTYTQAGSYSVVLTVTDNGGATNAVTKTVTVTAPPVNQAPTAAFSAGVNDLAVAFDGSASSDPDGSVANYAWSFGDNSSGTGQKPSHTYATAGTYTVVLTVTDNQGAVNSLTRAVTVTSGAATALAADAFGRTVAGGWGTADSGGAWTASGAKQTSSVAGGVGVSTVQTGGTGYQRLTSVSNLNTDVTYTVSLDAMPTGGGAYLGTIVRSTAAGDYYAQTLVKSSGQVTLYFTRAGTNVGSAVNVAGLTYTAGAKLSVRVQAVGSAPTTLRAKVWAAGTTEPASWQVSVTDATAGFQVAGGVGLTPYVSSSATAPVTARYDDVKVTTAQ